MKHSKGNKSKKTSYESMPFKNKAIDRVAGTKVNPSSVKTLMAGRKIK
tara:strand:+ start:2555 stop:2698 length:144 start_codon:yes stop_codon:yes gene_type:complete